MVSVARLQPQKNHKLLLKAFAEFVKEYSEYELHLFGIGELEEELRRQAKQLQIEDRVMFRGFSANVKEEIRDSAMFVLSSDYEGISNSMIEALAMGVPVIATDCPAGGKNLYSKWRKWDFNACGRCEGLKHSNEKGSRRSESGRTVIVKWGKNKRKL